MTKPLEMIFIAKNNDELRKQILEHLDMSEDSKIIRTCSTVFFDSYHKVVVEIPNEDETGVYNALIRPLVASYETIRGHLNGNMEASSRIKLLI
ncbi:MAG: hypothetical protein ACI4JB_01470 [Porcipelethomonas sp.]